MDSSRKKLRSYPVKFKVKKSNVPDSVENHTFIHNDTGVPDQKKTLVSETQ